MEHITNTIQRIECSGCGTFFASTTAFDFHRVGQFKEGTRRCMTSEELQAAGYTTETKNVRLAKNGQPVYQPLPVWYDAAGREKAREVFGAIREQELKRHGDVQP